MTAAGSRARSREIGYAEAMGEIGFLLRDEARRWKSTAGQQVVPFAGAALAVAADSLEQLADFALGAYSLHVDPGRGLARDAEHRSWLEREGYVPAGPRELPRREQSGS
jgi:hypothetical protein